jgi:hypothetical protein
MAWCRREALRLTHHVRLALGSPALVAGKVRDRPPPWDSSHAGPAELFTSAQSHNRGELLAVHTGSLPGIHLGRADLPVPCLPAAADANHHRAVTHRDLSTNANRRSALEQSLRYRLLETRRTGRYVRQRRLGAGASGAVQIG